MDVTLAEGLKEEEANKLQAAIRVRFNLQTKVEQTEKGWEGFELYYNPDLSQLRPGVIEAYCEGWKDCLSNRK